MYSTANKDTNGNEKNAKQFDLGGFQHSNMSMDFTG